MELTIAMDSDMVTPTRRLNCPTDWEKETAKRPSAVIRQPEVIISRTEKRSTKTPVSGAKTRPKKSPQGEAIHYLFQASGKLFTDGVYQHGKPVSEHAICQNHADESARNNPPAIKHSYIPYSR
jgi:hypothetical protein